MKIQRKDNFIVAVVLLVLVAFFLGFISSSLGLSLSACSL